MSIEELGRTADAARDYIYLQWGYYLHVKQTNVSGAEINNSVTRKFLKMGRMVEECYGPRPDNWAEWTDEV